MTANHKPVIELFPKIFAPLSRIGRIDIPKNWTLSIIFLPTRDSCAGLGRGHQQWSSPRKQAEYNLKYLIIAFCILILLVKLWTSIVIAAGIKKVQGTFIIQAPREIINIFWPGISFTCSLSGCLYSGGHGCWSRDLRKKRFCWHWLFQF